MFNNQRYLTKGVQSEIPIGLQLFMWDVLTDFTKNVIIFRYSNLKIWVVFRKSHTFQNSQNTTGNILSRQTTQSQQRFTS